MQVFVGHQLQQAPIALGLLQALAAVHQHRAVVVFQPAVALIQQVQHEAVGVAGGALLPHQPATAQAHLLHIPDQVGKTLQQPRITATPIPPGDPPVGDATHLEVQAAVGARLDGGVHQLIEIAGDPAPLGVLRQGHEGRPALRQLHLDPVGRPPFPLHLQHHGRQGQKGVLLIHVAGAHRQLGGHHPVGHGDRTRLGVAVQLPAGGGAAAQGQAGARLHHLEGLQLADVIADQVGARRPGGQLQPQPSPLGHDRELDPQQVPLGVAAIELNRNHRRSDRDVKRGLSGAAKGVQRGVTAGDAANQLLG